MEYPDAPERVVRLEEAVAVIRALWDGGPGTPRSEFYPLTEPRRTRAGPPPPIIIGGETKTGARLAGRIGDGWTAFDENFEANLPVYLEALRSGRKRSDQRVLVGFQGDWLSDEPIDDSPWITEPREDWARWRDAGADGVIVLARSTSDVDALVDAVDRW